MRCRPARQRSVDDLVADDVDAAPFLQSGQEHCAATADQRQRQSHSGRRRCDVEDDVGTRVPGLFFTHDIDDVHLVDIDDDGTQCQLRARRNGLGREPCRSPSRRSHRRRTRTARRPSPDARDPDHHRTTGVYTCNTDPVAGTRQRLELGELFRRGINRQSMEHRARHDDHVFAVAAVEPDLSGRRSR